jgi:hypothetical protein
VFAVSDSAGPPASMVRMSRWCVFSMALHLKIFKTSIILEKTFHPGALVHAWVRRSRRDTDHWLRASSGSIGLDNVHEPSISSECSAAVDAVLWRPAPLHHACLVI